MNESGSRERRLYELAGSLIRTARIGHGFTQTELAAAVGLTRTSVVNIEKGRQKLLLHKLFDFASALGLDPVALLPRIQESPQSNEIHMNPVPGHLSSETQDFIRSAMIKTTIEKGESKS